MASEQDLQQVRQIILEKLGKHSAQVFLFGSQATGRAVGASDIDVAVLPKDELPVGLLSLVREALEQSNIPFRVDLVDLSKADESFRQRVMREGIQWIA